MYRTEMREEALRLLAAGLTPSEVHRRLGVSRSVLVGWRRAGTARVALGDCPRCDRASLDDALYAELLGWYLGDGYLARARRGVLVLRIYNDLRYPLANERIAELITGVRPAAVPVAQARDGCLVTSAEWKHWACLFPQHGPGRKHERPIVLTPWQRAIVEPHPAPFLRGLFHSDGCRVRNWATRTVAGEKKWYDYPRWQFSNNSADIRGLCCWALDLVDIAWRQSNRTMISVSTRAGVARLDEPIGLEA